MITIFKEIYQFREVLWNLFSQDFKVKYKRTFFGFFWSLLNPICYLLVLSAVFSHLVRFDIENYTKFLFSGLLPWTFFQNTLASCVPVFIDSENFLKKVYLPKLIFPLSKTLIRGFDFIISFGALLIIGKALGFNLGLVNLLIPLAIIPLFFFTLGSGIIISIFTVYFRDIVYLITVFLQLLYFATPILYPLSQMSERHQMILKWNPLISQITLFQKMIYLNQLPSLFDWGLAYTVGFGMFVFGIVVLILKEQDLVFRL